MNMDNQQHWNDTNNWAHALMNHDLETENPNSNLNLNTNLQYLLSDCTSAAPLPSFLNTGSLPQENMLTQPETLGGQLSNFSLPSMMTLPRQTLGELGSSSFLTGNNNNALDIVALQRQLMEQHVRRQRLEQEMLQSLQIQRMSNNEFQRNPSYLQHMAGLSLPAQRDPSLELLSHSVANSALLRTLLPRQGMTQRPSTDSVLGINLELSQESEAHKPDVGQGAVKKEKSNFPAKLYRLLEDPASQEYISWLPNGRAWKILKQHEFEENIIPLFFRHAKLSSFMRQVNGWGFRRTTSGLEPNAYHHEMFIRGHPRLCAEMRRPPHKLQTKPRQAGGRPNLH